MRIGILETDKVRENLIEEFGSYPDMFRRLLGGVDPTLDFTEYDIIGGHYPNDIDACDAYLITGSKCSAYDDLPWIKTLQSFICDLDRQSKKLVGICFGHQLIAVALGGRTEKNPHGWGAGLCDYTLYQTPAWLKPEKRRFSLLATHQDQVLQLPAGAVRLAGSAFCQNAMFSIGSHILTFQAHPEFCREYCARLIEIRREMIGEVGSEQALASMAGDNDSQLIAKWIVNFVKE